MTCHDARQHWNLYHDSEGDAELHFRLGEHLAMCPECAQWFSQQSRLESLVEERLRLTAASIRLWERVLGRSGLRTPARVRAWVLFSGLAATFLVLAAFSTWLVWYWNVGRHPDLAKLSTDWHERLVSRVEEPSFRSQSDVEVENYLKKEVSFPVRCPPRSDAGFAVEGAGVCKLRDQPAAFLVGHVESTPVSIFILSRESLASFPRQKSVLESDRRHRCRERDVGMVAGVIDRNLVLVVGATDTDRLERVLNAYGTYPEH